MSHDIYDFENIYNEYQLKIQYYLQRMIGREEADDLTQDVFLKVLHGLCKFNGNSKLSTWIYKIATNTALDRLRSAPYKNASKTLTNSEMLEKGPVASGDTKSLPTDEQLIDNEMNSCIRADIDNLPDKYRTIIVLSELQELSNQEIAEILGITLENVKIRLHRARGLLKKELDGHCNYYHNSKDNLACAPK